MSSSSAGDRGDSAGWARPDADADPRGADPRGTAAGSVELTGPRAPATAPTSPVHPPEPIWAIGASGPQLSPTDPEYVGDPVAKPADPADPADPAGPDELTPRRWGLIEVSVALGVAAALAGLAFPLGWLWAWVSPHVVLEMTKAGPAYVEANPEGYVAAEAVYLLISAVVGLGSAVAVWLLARRQRGPILLAGLALGSIVGGAVMAWYGHYIDAGDYERLLREAPIGDRFEVPVKVRASSFDPWLVQGAVLAQALVAVATYTLMAGFYATPSLRPERNRPRPAEPPVSSGWPAPSGHPAAPEPPAAG